MRGHPAPRPSAPSLPAGEILRIMNAASRGTVPNRIADHGVIGDMRTAALVAVDGTIDYFCHPDLDAPSLFCSLLHPGAGFFSLCVDNDGFETRQIYLPDTNILLTRFLNDGAIGEVSDFMPTDGSGRIVRRAKAVHDAIDELEHATRGSRRR